MFYGADTMTWHTVQVGLALAHLGYFLIVFTWLWISEGVNLGE